MKLHEFVAPQVQDQIATCNGGPCGNQRGRARTRSADKVGPCRPGRTRRNFSFRPTYFRIFGACTSSRTGITRRFYAVDPRGLTPFEFDLSTQGQANVSLTKDRAMLESTMDTLRILADETDGRAIVNSNDLDKDFCQIFEIPARTICSFTSTLSQPDGKFTRSTSG